MEISGWYFLVMVCYLMLGLPIPEAMEGASKILFHLSVLPCAIPAFYREMFVRNLPQGYTDSDCHAEIDRRTMILDNKDARLYHLEGVIRTQAILLKEGKIKP